MDRDWFGKIDGVVLGPMSLQELKFLASQGKLKRTHEVRKGRDGDWVPPSKIRGLFPSIKPKKAEAPPPNAIAAARPDQSTDEEWLKPLGDKPYPLIPKPKRVKGGKSRNRVILGAVFAVAILAVVSLIVVFATLNSSDTQDDPLVATADESSPPSSSEDEQSSSDDEQSGKSPVSTSTPPRKGTAQPSTSTANTKASPGNDTETPAASAAPVLYLTDLQEIDVEVWRYRPWFGFGKNGTFVESEDRGTKKIVLGGKESPHGIFAHPTNNGRSKVEYDLQGRRYSHLQAIVGVADYKRYPPQTPLTFEVWGDEKLLWRSEPVKHWGEPHECRVALPELSRLELRVECPGGAAFAYAVWCEVRLTNQPSNPRDAGTGSGPDEVADSGTGSKGTPNDADEKSGPPTTDVATRPGGPDGEMPKAENKPEEDGPQPLPDSTARTDPKPESKNSPYAKNKALTALFPSGRVYDPNVFNTELDQLAGPSKGNEDALVVFSRRDGSEYGVGAQRRGKPHGITIAQHPNGNLMLHMTYDDGSREGLMKAWRESGTPALFTEYKNGRRHGLCCYFGESGDLAALIENDFNKPTTIRVASGVPGTILEFPSESEAERDPTARTILADIRALEESVMTNERRFRSQIRAAEKDIRQQRSTSLVPQKRVAARKRAANNAAKARAFYEGAVRRHFGR